MEALGHTLLGDAGQFWETGGAPQGGRRQAAGWLECPAPAVQSEMALRRAGT